jgi:hypothetical protein
MSRRLPDELRKVLASSGLPWHIDTGTRHFKLIINGRFAAIIPKGKAARSTSSQRAGKNTVAQVRRVIKGCAP